MSNEKLAELEKRIVQIEKSLEALKQCKRDNEFTEYNGMLFKKNGDGTWAKAIFCPNCKISVNILPRRSVTCRCRWTNRFDYNSVDEILVKLPK